MGITILKFKSLSKSIKEYKEQIFINLFLRNVNGHRKETERESMDLKYKGRKNKHIKEGGRWR
jgi:hypothetical protein